MTVRKIAALAAPIAVALGAPVQAMEPPPAPPLLTGIRLELIALSNDDPTPRPLPDGANIPYVEGRSCYGWRLRFTPVAAELQLEERLVLPGAAREWGSDDGSAVADDRASARTLVTANGSGGEATHAWCVARGDPRGPYRFVIRHGKRVLGQLRFTVGVKL